MEFSDITYATRELIGNASEMLNCELANGDYAYGEFVEVDTVAETLVLRFDGGIQSYTTAELCDITVSEDY